MPYGRGVVGIPKTRKVTHRFCSPNGFVTMLGATPNLEANVISANGLTNPGDALGSGFLTEAGPAASDVHDPLLTDQLEAVYDKYVVLKSKIRVDFFNSETGSATLPQAVICGIGLKDDETQFENLGQYQENGYSKFTALGPEGVATVMYGIAPPAFFGSKSPSSDSTLVAAFGGTPTNELFYHIWAHPINNRANPAVNWEVAFSVYVEYEVLWMEPKDVTRSA